MYEILCGGLKLFSGSVYLFRRTKCFFLQLTDACLMEIDQTDSKLKIGKASKPDLYARLAKKQNPMDLDDEKDLRTVSKGKNTLSITVNNSNTKNAGI